MKNFLLLILSLISCASSMEGDFQERKKRNRLLSYGSKFCNLLSSACNSISPNCIKPPKKKTPKSLENPLQSSNRGELKKYLSKAVPGFLPSTVLSFKQEDILYYHPSNQRIPFAKIHFNTLGENPGLFPNSISKKNYEKLKKVDLLKVLLDFDYRYSPQCLRVLKSFTNLQHIEFLPCYWECALFTQFTLDRLTGIDCFIRIFPYLRSVTLDTVEYISIFKSEEDHEYRDNTRKALKILAKWNRRGVKVIFSNAYLTIDKFFLEFLSQTPLYFKSLSTIRLNAEEIFKIRTQNPDLLKNIPIRKNTKFLPLADLSWIIQARNFEELKEMTVFLPSLFQSSCGIKKMYCSFFFPTPMLPFGDINIYWYAADNNFSQYCGQVLKDQDQRIKDQQKNQEELIENFHKKTGVKKIEFNLKTHS